MPVLIAIVSHHVFHAKRLSGSVVVFGVVHVMKSETAAVSSGGT